jgi:ankyrin repeat protein
MSLFNAVVNNNLEHVLELLIAGHSPNSFNKKREEVPPLLIACYNNHHEIIDALLTDGAKPNLTSDNADNMTPLMVAQDLDTVKKLMSHGADAGRLDDSGNSAIHHFIRDFSGESNGFLMTQELLNAGANPNVMNINYETPLILAAKYGDIKMIILLLQNGAALNDDSQLKRAIQAATRYPKAKNFLQDFRNYLILVGGLRRSKSRAKLNKDLVRKVVEMLRE